MKENKYKCPLCGFKFDATDVKCRSCPMSKSCNVTCCPNCGYGFTGESRLIEWFKRRFKTRGLSPLSDSKKEPPDETPEKEDAA